MLSPHIGGYIGLENIPLRHFHKTELRFNSARSALRFLIESRGYKHVYLPLYICDCFEMLLDRMGISFSFYPVGKDLLPDTHIKTGSGEVMLIVNYFGMLDNSRIEELKSRHGTIVIDNTQAFFQPPCENTDTLYTARKFFPVADGAYLFMSGETAAYTALPREESTEFSSFLFGRAESSPEAYYDAFRKNEEHLEDPACKKMSLMSENLLSLFDYDAVLEARKRNFGILSRLLDGINRLDTSKMKGFFCYPLLTDKGGEIRQKLIAKRIFIPKLWGCVCDRADSSSFEYELAENCVMLPVDQRYGAEEMEYMTQCIKDIRI